MRGDFGTLSHIPLGQIDRDLDQPRKTFDEETIAELANSIREGGLVEPLVVKNSSETKGRFVLVAGERRYRALSLLGEKFAPCIIRPGQQDTYILSVIENLNREDLNPIDEAQVYRKMRDERRMSWREIHDVTRRSIPTIMTKVKLLELPEEIQAMVRTGTLPQVGALQLTQYKGESGDLIRLAYDLIAGREQVEFQQDTTEHGENVMRGKVPKDPRQVMGRIMGHLWRARSMRLLADAFAEFDADARKEALKKLNTPTRKNLLNNLDTLSAAFAKLRASMVPILEVIDEEAKKPIAPPVAKEPRKERVRNEDPIPARWATPPALQTPPPPIVSSKPGEAWKSAITKSRPSESAPKPVFSVLPKAIPMKLEPLLLPRRKVEAKPIDLTKLTKEQLDQAANLVYRVFTFRGSRTPQVERRKCFLSRVTGIPEETVQERVWEALRIVRQLWSDGNGFTHEEMRQRIITLKESSGALTFDQFYTAVPADIKDDTFISFEPLL